MSATSAIALAREKQHVSGLVAERATLATFLVADSLSILIAFTVAVLLKGALGSGALWPQYFRLMPALAILPLLIWAMDLYPGVLMNPVDELRRLSVSITVGMSLFMVVTYLLRESAIYSRFIFLTSIPLGLILALTGRRLVRKIYAKKSWWGVPTVLVGSRDEVDRIRRLLKAQPWIGIRVVAVMEAGSDGMIYESAVPGPNTAAYALVAVPLGADRDWIRRVERMVWGCKKIIVLPPSMELFWSWMSIRDCCGLLGLEVQRELLRRSSRTVKRSMDWSLALMGCILVAPLVILLAVLIRRASRGPVFYGQDRLGEGGKIFAAWKFRTMVVNADELLERYLNENPEMLKEWEADHKLKNDPRITPVGRFLRRTSLDELPQLWNVLRGDMSLVGPRPIVSAETLKYGEEFELYLKVRPGITGLWQVSGRNDLTYKERVSLDVYYVRNWSVWLDCYLLAKTVGVVIRKQGAY